MSNIAKIIKAIMKSKHVSQTQLAKLFDVSPQAINNKFRRDTWTLDEVLNILDYLDCEVVIKPKDYVSYTVKKD